MSAPHRDALGVAGRVEVLVFRHGALVDRIVGENLVVNGGLNLALTQLAGLSSTPVAYMALGSSATTPAATDTALGAEAPGPNGVRQAVTKTLQPPGTLLFSAAWSESQNQNTTINEVGLFTNSTGGGGDVMFSRFHMPAPLPKDQFTAVQINYSVILSAS
jgi:hypothetical protein